MCTSMRTWQDHISRDEARARKEGIPDVHCSIVLNASQVVCLSPDEVI